MAKQVKRIVGAGPGGYRGDVLLSDTTEKVARHYSKGYVGGNAVIYNPTLPIWNDRNTNNADTKLSKEKPFGGPKKMPRIPGKYPNVKPRKPNS